jgi:hypothetical protein
MMSTSTVPRRLQQDIVISGAATKFLQHLFFHDILDSQSPLVSSMVAFMDARTIDDLTTHASAQTTAPRNWYLLWPSIPNSTISRFLKVGRHRRRAVNPALSDWYHDVGPDKATTFDEHDI